MILRFSNHETIILHPALAACDPATRSVFVADLHLGKTAAFHRAGIPMPEGSDADTLQRLSRLIAQTSAQNLVILGDVFHTRYAAMEPVLHRIAAWRAQHPAVRISIVPGNHDRCVPWSDWLPGAAILEAGTKLGAFRVMHHPALLEAEPVLCGHLHPGCAIGTRRMEKRTVPCFWLRDQTLVLPAFGAFTGLAKVRIGSVGKVFVPCGEKVIELTPAKVAPAPVKR